MRSYLSGRRINITLIFMCSSSYLVHAISCSNNIAKISLFAMFIIIFIFFGFPFYFFRPDPPPATRHPLPATRHPQPATRHPSPVTRGKVLPCFWTVCVRAYFWKIAEFTVPFYQRTAYSGVGYQWCLVMFFWTSQWFGTIEQFCAIMYEGLNGVVAFTVNG